MRGHWTPGRVDRAHDAGDDRAVLVKADLEDASRRDQALRRPTEPLVRQEMRIGLQVRVGHERRNLPKAFGSGKAMEPGRVARS